MLLENLATQCPLAGKQSPAGVLRTGGTFVQVLRAIVQTSPSSFHAASKKELLRSVLRVGGQGTRDTALRGGVRKRGSSCPWTHREAPVTLPINRALRIKSVSTAPPGGCFKIN